MIDFRYHLVSLISVFLALAVGVVLGAGPLQNSLGDALNNQVVSLREDRNATQAQLEETEAAVNNRDAYIEAAGSALVAGTLADRHIALVVMPEASGDDVEAVKKHVEAAGASVASTVSLTTVWADAARETFRSTYSGQFAGYLSAPSSATGNTVLGMGLGTALSASDSNATALADLLTASDTPLMQVDGDLSQTADGVVVVGARAADSATTPTAEPGSDAASAWGDAMTGLSAVLPTVVVGDGSTQAGLVSQLRSAKAKVTTIDGVGQASAWVSVPLALAQAERGTTAAYGFDDGADGPMPAVPQASAAQAEQADAAAGSEAATGTSAATTSETTTEG